MQTTSTKMPKVSVVVPVYNAENSLERCLDSIISQEFKNIEVILVNDGSKDSSQRICLSYQKRYPHKIVIHEQKNSGPAAARNKGIEISSGKYIAFVDADDTIMPNMISTMVLKAEENDADMVICAYFHESCRGSTEVSYRYTEGVYAGEKAKEIAHAMINETSETDIPPYSWVRLTKKSVFDESGLRFHDGLIRSEDFHFWTKVHFVTKRIYILSNSQLYHYIDTDGSVTNRYIHGYWKDALFIFNDLLQSLPKSKEVRRRLGIMLIRRSLIALNNACRCADGMQAKNDMKEIVYDSVLNDVIKNLTYDDVKRYRLYPVLMKFHGKKLIVTKYMLRYIKYRKRQWVAAHIS
jgi:glycosyltransferase involved in cell wall biosynthesis